MSLGVLYKSLSTSVADRPDMFFFEVIFSFIFRAHRCASKTERGELDG